MTFLTVNDIYKSGFSYYGNAAVIPKKKTSKAYNSFDAIMQQCMSDSLNANQI